MQSQAITRADAVIASIRADILNGRLAPGSKLAFAELGALYGVSTGVLREVLSRLTEQGLATSRPQLGYRVMTLSVDELHHLTEARVAIETQVLRQSIQTGDLEWEAQVVSAHHRLSQLPNILHSEELSPEWLEAHRRFHAVLLEGCPNPRLRDLATHLRDLNEVYHCWSVRESATLSERDAEHRHLAEAAVSRDVKGATQTLKEHIEKTTELLIHSRRMQMEMETSAAQQHSPIGAGSPLSTH